MTTSAAATLPASSAALAREAPWWTTTRRPGVNLAASAAQLPTTAGGAMTSAGPPPCRAGEVGQHGRRLAEAHVEGQAAAEPDGVEEAEPAEGLGLVAAQLAVEPLGARDGLGGGLLGPFEQLGGPAGALDHQPPGQRRALEPDGVAQHLGAGEACAARRSASAAAASLRSARSSSTHFPRERTSGRASAARRAMSAAVSSTSSNTADQRTLPAGGRRPPSRRWAR